MKNFLLVIFAAVFLSAPAFAAPPGQYCSSVEVTIADTSGKNQRRSTNFLHDATCTLSIDKALEVHRVSVALLEQEFPAQALDVSTNKKNVTNCVTVKAWVGKWGKPMKKNSKAKWIHAKCGMTEDEAAPELFAYKARIGAILLAIGTPNMKTRSSGPSAQAEILGIVGK